jgi:hypothetical protein
MEADMNRALLAILAVFCITVGACSKNNATSESPSSQPNSVTIEPAEPVVSGGTLEDDPFGEVPEPRKPAPALPVVAEATDNPEALPADSTSAAEVMDSVGRVLRRTIGADEDEAESKGSIFRSIGRALTKGAQEAASAEPDEAEE